MLAREAAGREAQPTAGIVDSQSVKTSESGGSRGYDAGKKINGRKRHVLVDTLGFLLRGIVHPTDVQDRDWLAPLLVRIRRHFPFLGPVFADGGYQGEVAAAAARAERLELAIVKRSDRGVGFGLRRLPGAGGLARCALLARAGAPLARGQGDLDGARPGRVVQQRAGDHRAIPGAHGTHPSPHVDVIAQMAYEMITVQVFQDRLSDRAHATHVFREHFATVRAEIAPERLLTVDLRQGWPPLCAFLGVAVPDSPFPHTNSSKAFVEAEWKQG